MQIWDLASLRMGHCIYAFLSVLFDLLYVRVACFIQQDGIVMNIPPSFDPTDVTSE